MASSPIKQLGSFFKNKRVLVTGHTGFKGSWMSLVLHFLGAKIYGLSLDPEEGPNHYRETDLKGLMEGEYIGDLADFSFIKKALDSSRPDIIIHMAAQAIVLDSYDAPRETFITNSMGVVNLLEAIRIAERPCHCLVVTTDKCYENREWVYPYRENDPLGGRDPYSASKASAEIIAHSYIRSFFPLEKREEHGVFVQTARGGNVIGGGDWSDYRIIPDCIKALQKGEPIVIRNPYSIRPWQHVLDVCYGYLTLIMKESKTPSSSYQAWNFGPLNDQIIPVEELVKMVIQEWGHGEYKIQGKTKVDPPHEAKYLKLETTKSRELLGWGNQYNGQQAIQKSIQWYRSNFEETESLSQRDLSLNEIKTYFKGEKGSGGLKTRNFRAHPSIL